MLGDIPFGRRDAISLDELCLRWRMSPRKARRMIAQLRRLPSPDGSVILSASTAPGGYWRSADPVEIRRYIQETEARARHVRAPLREARRALGRLEVESIEEDQLSFLNGGIDL